MGSVKGNGGRDRGRKYDRRRRESHSRLWPVLPAVEGLEDRTLMSVPGSPPPSFKPTSTNLQDAVHGPLANAGQLLISAYSNYQVFLSKGGTTGFDYSSSNSLNKLILFQGNSVGVNVSVYTDANSSLNNAISALQNLGMSVTGTDQAMGIVEGFLPISQLPTAANLSTVDGARQVVNISPIFHPTINASPPPIQADQTLFANVARCSST